MILQAQLEALANASLPGRGRAKLHPEGAKGRAGQSDLPEEKFEKVFTTASAEHYQLYGDAGELQACRCPSAAHTCP